MRTLIKNTIGIWLILTIASLPFPYFIFYSFFSYPSDSISSYYATGIAIPCSLLIAFLQNRYKLIESKKLESILFVSAAYMLSYFLLKYGTDKLLLRQFYSPEPNILYTPTGELSKDILFWTSMGTSKSYNFFMGAIEIIPGILLLHHKTRILGALFAFGVLLNVFMINVGFNISVKLLSACLLMASLYLLQPFFRQLVHLFIKQKGVSALTAPHLFFQNNLLKRTLKAIIICLIVLDVVLPYLEQKSIQEIQLETYVGSYESESKSSKILNHSVKRIHIHSRGYLIFEDAKGGFHDYKFTIIGNTIHPLNKKISIEINQSTCTINYEGNKQKFKKLKPTDTPLLKDEFHWTVEGMINNSVDP